MGVILTVEGPHAVQSLFPCPHPVPAGFAPMMGWNYFGAIVVVFSARAPRSTPRPPWSSAR